MVCVEKQRLAVEYHSETKFAGAVSALQQKMGTSPKSAYERLSRAADETRVKSEQARLALEQHGCRPRLLEEADVWPEQVECRMEALGVQLAVPLSSGPSAFVVLATLIMLSAVRGLSP